MIDGRLNGIYQMYYPAIVECTNNIPAPSLVSNSSKADSRNGWLLIENIFGQTCPSSVKIIKHSLDRDNCKYIFSQCKVWWCVPKVWRCVLCTLELSPVANHRYDRLRVHDNLKTTIRSQDDDPVGKLAIRFLSFPGWSVEQPFCHLHSEIQQKVYLAVLSGQQVLWFRLLSRCPWCRASKTIQESFFFQANRRLKNILQFSIVQTMYRLPPSFPTLPKHYPGQKKKNGH